jgi:hypothetical protein
VADFIEKMRGEWTVIRGAPWSFVGIACSLIALTWFFSELIHNQEIADKNATIESLKTQIDSYKGNLSGATPEEAKARITALEARLAKLEPRPPRRLSDEQRFVIKSRIATVSGAPLSLAYDTACLDCYQYAADFDEIFTSVNWTVYFKRLEGSFLLIPYPAPSTSPKGKGLSIVAKVPPDDVQEARILADALSVLKIPFDLTLDDTQDLTSFYITITEPGPPKTR